MGQTNNKPGAHLGALSSTVCGGKKAQAEPERFGTSPRKMGSGSESDKRRPSMNDLPKIMLADLPEVTVNEPSQDTQDDLKAAKAFHKVQDLNAEDIVVVKGSWNRVTAWKDMIMEAMIYRWIRVCPMVYETLKVKFDELPHDMFILIDSSVRNLDPRTEVHHRESYTKDFPGCTKREFGTSPEEILMHYTILGMRPSYWIALKEAFLWAMKTHNPYMYNDHDKVDLDKGEQGAVARFFHNHVVGGAMSALDKFCKELMGDGALMIHRQAEALKPVTNLGQNFYVRLLSKYPELLDYFANADMDHLAQHLQQVMEFVACQGIQLRDSIGTLQRLSAVHRAAMIPTWAYPLLGEVLMEVLCETLEMPAEALKSWQFLYMVSATTIQVPMAVEERIYQDAEDFFQTLARDEDWTPNRLDARMKEVQVEIGLTGTYRHTAEEIQAGARIAWRNSPKCIGRISWDTLVVRDCRTVTEPNEMFKECQEHLKLATCGQSIQSVMTVFAPKKPNEKWGTRMWNSQFTRYAAYEQADGSILGDPGNLDYTKLCIDHFNWQPPEKRTAFDPLPTIIDAVGRRPQLFEFPKDIIMEVKFEHPSNKDFAKLGLKWAAVPAICNFNMRIGGVDYPCCPFNGWFVDLEIARNLVERYDKGPEIAKVMGYDTSKDYTGWRSKVVADMCAAVTYSFRKAQFSIVDHYTVSTQFLTHVDREKALGREVPAQWSWIGGYVGHHCPVWHYEMRDFYLRPQYHYCCDKYVVEGILDGVDDSPNGATSEAAPSASELEPICSRALILYASVTGTSERFAKRISTELGLAYQPRVTDLNSFREEDVARYTHILFVVSTFGDGGPPANGAELKEPLPWKLQHPISGAPTRFAVLALGSSVYPQFCAFGKKVEQIMMKAGGERFMQMITADEVKSQTDSLNHFLAGVRTQLPPAAPPPDVVAPEFKIEIEKGELRLDQKDSLAQAGAAMGHHVGVIKLSEELLKQPDDARSTRRIDIDISACGEAYHTGGHLSVLPANPAEEVMRLGAALGLKKEQMHAPFKAYMVEGIDKFPATLHFKPTTLFEALTWYYDIKLAGGNLDDVLQLVHDADGVSAKTMEKMLNQDRDSTVSCFWWISRLFENFAVAGKIDVSKFLTVLSRQAPRLYSVASSNVVSPKVVSLCVAGVTVEEHKGLCSNFLHGLKPGAGVLVATRTSSFRLPPSLQSPIIMVGPGTGVAPFIGFIQERMKIGKMGGDFAAARLYFGCRNKNEAIHEDLLMKALESKALTLYSVSCSRERDVPKQYVSDALRKDGENLWELLKNPNCHYYVCGDGRMADSAYDSLLPCIQEHGQMSRAKAVAFLDAMRSQGRYHLDVWGLVLHFQRAKTAMRVKTRNKANEWLKLVQEDQED